MNQYERMISGRLYSWRVPDKKREELWDKRNTFLDLFNQTSYGDFETREKLIRKYFAHVGIKPCITKPFHCDYAKNISVGDYFFANFNCVFLDTAPITIGSHVFIGPNVSIYTAAHPISARTRKEDLEYAKPVIIKDDVWIGGSTVINPGVTIGTNVVIGSGSVVTKDIPNNVIAFGVPCKVYRKITKEDEKKWQDDANDFFEELRKEGIIL